MSMPDRTVQALFSRDGAFRYGRCTGLGSSQAELTLTQVVDLLEEHGKPTTPTP